MLAREQVEAAVWERLESTSLILHGARRMGKSTLLLAMAAQPRAGWRAVRVDLEGMHINPLAGLLDTLRQQLEGAGLWSPRSELAAQIEEVNLGGVGGKLRAPASIDPWAALRDTLSTALSRLPVSERLIIALDELPWWLDAVEAAGGPGSARAALASLRRLRQEASFVDRVRLVLTGSVGLSGQVASLDAGAELNDLDTLLLPPLSPAAGAALFETELLSRSLSSAEASSKHAHLLAGGSPHWIKQLAARVGAPGARGPADVDAAVDRLLHPSERHRFDDEGHQHFRRRYKKWDGALRGVLEALSSADHGHPFQGAVNAALGAQAGLARSEARDVVYLLFDGFYLAEAEDGTLSWYNPIFRRWWERYGSTT